jgi:Kdo2-lipid IVA lauroyltransferase/acyltransferase
MRERLEYYLAFLVLKGLGVLPRGAARALGVGVARLFFALRPALRRVADFNLRLAFPDWTETQRQRTISKMVRNIGQMAGEFSQFPKYTPQNVYDTVQMVGEENYRAAEQAGKGLLLLGGHIGAWELSSFALGLYGHPCHFLVRAITNSRVDALVNEYRGLSGGKPIEKNESARVMFKVLHAGGAVGILADHNTALEEGVFVDFFGVPACSTSGLARIALRTGAAVVPVYALWDETSAKYRLHIDPQVELIRTGDADADVRTYTARFIQIIENIARAYPDQWLWVHKRWKTRPPGEKPIYPS